MKIQVENANTQSTMDGAADSFESNKKKWLDFQYLILHINFVDLSNHCQLL